MMSPSKYLIYFNHIQCPFLGLTSSFSIPVSCRFSLHIVTCYSPLSPFLHFLFFTLPTIFCSLNCFILNPVSNSIQPALTPTSYFPSVLVSTIHASTLLSHSKSNRFFLNLLPCLKMSSEFHFAQMMTVQLSTL